MVAEKISIIIPVLNESESLEKYLLSLQTYRNKQCEIIVVDGGSCDGTPQIAAPYCDFLLDSKAGRAKQLNEGAKNASGSVLLFLHADTILPPDFFNLITKSLKQNNKCWGRFNVSLSGRRFMFRVIEKMINVRSCFSGIATGDQAIFVKRSVFKKIGGFSDIPLMEDVVLSQALKRIEPPVCINTPVVTSSRRWEQYGIWRTIFLMWRLRAAFFFGANPVELKKKYL